MTRKFYQASVVAMVAVGIAGSFLAAGNATADTAGTTYWFQGTGNTAPAPDYIRSQANANGSGLVDMSVDRGWKADFRPVQGQDTADQSIANGNQLAGTSVKQDLANGKRVVLEGFSLGALAAGDLAAYMAREGVDMSNVQVTLISDGRMANTGALMVLQPLKPILDIIGITPGPRATNFVGHWKVICIEGDGVCDTPDPVRDPLGGLDSLVGYLTKHGALDKQYNYNNLDNLESTTTVDGNVETVVYHAPRAIPRLVQVITGSSELSDRMNQIMDKLTTSRGEPGQPKTYKSIPETIRDVVSVAAPQAPLLPTTQEEVPVFVGNTAYTVTVDAATVLGGTVGNQVAGPVGQQVGQYAGQQLGQAVAPYVQQGVEAATRSAMTGNTKPLEDFANSMIPGLLPPR